MSDTPTARPELSPLITITKAELEDYTYLPASDVSDATATLRLRAELDAQLAAIAEAQAENSRFKHRIGLQERQIERYLPCPDCRDKVKQGECQRCLRQRAEAALERTQAERDDMKWHREKTRQKWEAAEQRVARLRECAWLTDAVCERLFYEAHRGRTGVYTVFRDVISAALTAPASAAPPQLGQAWVSKVTNDPDFDEADPVLLSIPRIRDAVTGELVAACRKQADAEASDEQRDEYFAELLQEAITLAVLNGPASAAPATREGA